MRASQVQLMGVINTTPDSFSDGGSFDTFDKAFAEAQQMIASGADILDIGGESTRPGSQAVDEQEELARTIPLIAAIRELSAIPISIDTNKSEVMRAAVDAGANLINSVWALRLEDSLQVAAQLAGAGVPDAHAGYPGNHATTAELRERGRRGQWSFCRSVSMRRLRPVSPGIILSSILDLVSAKPWNIICNC